MLGLSKIVVKRVGGFSSNLDHHRKTFPNTLQKGVLKDRLSSLRPCGCDHYSMIFG